MPPRSTSKRLKTSFETIRPRAVSRIRSASSSSSPASRTSSSAGIASCSIASPNWPRRRFEINTLVQPQPQKERLFKGLLAPDDDPPLEQLAFFCKHLEPGGRTCSCIVKIFIKIARIRKPHRARIGQQHRVSIETKANIGLPLPILQIMPRAMPLRAKFEISYCCNPAASSASQAC